MKAKKTTWGMSSSLSILSLVKKPIPWIEPTYVFGYGSLMYPSGLNELKRGMTHLYDWKELEIAELKGFKRSMSANYGNVAFYGIRQVQRASCNGVVFRVHDLQDYEGLLMSEFAHPYIQLYYGKQNLVYEATDVTQSISGFEVPSGGRVIAFVVPKTKRDGDYYPYYVEKVWQGIQPWGEEFVSHFLETGGLQPPEKRSYFRYLRNFAL